MENKKNNLITEDINFDSSVMEEVSVIDINVIMETAEKEIWSFDSEYANNPEAQKNDVLYNKLAEEKKYAEEKLAKKYKEKFKKLQRKDDKDRLAFLRKEVDSLQANLKEELEYIKKNGGECEVEKIEQITSQISAATKLYIKKREEYETCYGEKFKVNVLSQTKEALNGVITKDDNTDNIPAAISSLNAKISETSDVIKNGYESLSMAGISTLESISDTLKLSIKQFKQIGKEAFNGLSEKISSINRAGMILQYGLASYSKKILEKNISKLENKYMNQNRRKGIINNIRQLIKGKPTLDIDTIPLTEEQIKKINDLKDASKGAIEFFQNVMNDMTQKFQLSINQSVQQAQDNQKTRESLGMKESSGLDSIICAAKEQSKNMPDIKNENYAREAGIHTNDVR